MYREEAAPGIPGAVRWASVSRGDGPVRVLPDGCLDLLWSSRSGLLVAGPDRQAHLSVSVPGERWVGLRLPPGIGPAVFGIPADELRDLRVPLDDLWGPAATDLADRVAAAEARGWPVGGVLEEVALRRLRAAGGPDPLGARVAARLAAGATVAATAAEVGLGARALHRRSRLLFGYGPKTLARILRMRRALDLAGAGTPLAEVAVLAGYADQAHLTREVKEFAGVPPTRLLPPAA
ncbi:AraC family transcriptional regulator [Micromonospora chersina]|uniref:Transcriptional regulator, AraC family n=1 Tax=Micromonospora chersina TaxID=47854 RepID=A0A1C6UFS4_9ACTN|nr:helix-turn-helix domain-containing protein [Micromonospora chersina]SCL52801.1 transcriptional regulator, AraC family [Micromonospora chersina]